MHSSSDFERDLKVQEANTNPHILLFLNKILRRWWLFVIGVGVGVIAAFFVIRYSTPVYKITSKLLVEDEKKGGGSFNSSDFLGDMSSLLNVKSNIDNEVEILKTREIAEKAVRGLDLNITYYRSGTFKNNEIYPSPFKVTIVSPADTVKTTSFEFIPTDELSGKVSYKDNAIDKKVSIDIVFDRPFIVKEIGVVKIVKDTAAAFTEKGYRFKITSIDNATEKLQKDMTIAVTNKMVSIVDLSINHTIPKKGEEILSKFIEGYMEMNVLDKNTVADSTIHFIDNRLSLVSLELENIEQNIQNFKQKNQLTDIPEQAKLLVSNTNHDGKEISSLKTQISVIEALEEYLKDESKSKNSVPSSVLHQDVVFNKLSENYNAFLLDRERQLLTSTEDNPYINNLDQRISSLRKAMLSNLAGTKHSLNIKVEKMQKDLDLLNGQINKVPVNERTYLGMFRQQSLKQELYLFLLQKREEVALSKTSNISSFKIIEHPKSGFKPHKLNGLMILALGVLIGMAFPFAGIYLQDMLNNRVQSKEDITQLLSIPMIGQINKVKDENLLVQNDPKSILSEQFRDLRSNLNFFFNAEKGLSLLLTSSMQAEGKTFTSMNLGNIIALTGKKVLLIDLDLRVANLTEKFEMKNKPGFTNYIISTNDSFQHLIYPSKINENLFVMPSGMLPPNPAETLMRERTGELMQKLREEYHYIILDTPPIGLVSDAQLLSKHVSISLYLIRQNHTYKNQLHNIKELHQLGKMGTMGIVFNDIKSPTNAKYGYGEYGYGVKKQDSYLKSLVRRFGQSNAKA